MTRLPIAQDLLSFAEAGNEAIAKAGCRNRAVREIADPRIVACLRIQAARHVRKEGVTQQLADRIQSHMQQLKRYEADEKEVSGNGTDDR